MKHLTLMVALASLSGCAMTPRPMPSVNTNQDMMRSPSVAGVVRCLANTIRGSPLAQMRILVGPVESESTGGTYTRGNPQPVFTTTVTGTLIEVGLSPLSIPFENRTNGGINLRAAYRPDIAVTGGVVDFAPLIEKVRDAVDGGIGFGKGRGDTTLSAGIENSISVGSITARIVLEEPQTTADGKVWWVGKTTREVSGQFRLHSQNKNLSASIFFGIGAGAVVEHMNVIDVQHAATRAIQMALLLALAERLQLTTNVCT